MLINNAYTKTRYAYYKGRAKINLTLEVGRAREDGFHQVSMIMQSLRLWDDVELACTDASENTVVCNIPYLESPEKNLALRAVALMQEKYGISQKVQLTLRKKIPIAAGLAGGSTDAAAAIRCMNKLFSLRLSTDEMMEIGAALGSDIPFCLLGGTCLATGRGETIQPVDAFPRTPVVLIKPDFGVSTPWAYQQFDRFPPAKKPDVPKLLEMIRTGKLSQVSPCLVNMLEEPVCREYPEIAELKQKLLDKGAVAACMSGSGPTVYGLFATDGEAASAYSSFRNELPRKYYVIQTSTENPRYQPSGNWNPEG